MGGMPPGMNLGSMSKLLGGGGGSLKRMKNRNKRKK
jgi:hypothetical protein